MLRYKRLNEVIATDTYIACERSLEGYYCAQVFFGMTSKSLYVAGMNTESEFPDVYLDFIRQNGIPSALRSDNAKSEMNQRVRQIHRDLVLANRWKEPHSPCQISSELNVKYLKSHAQFQLDHLRQLHTLEKLEDGHDRSWECIKVLEYAKERIADDGVDHICLVE
jgi:hypothetical protein